MNMHQYNWKEMQFSIMENYEYMMHIFDFIWKITVSYAYIARKGWFYFHSYNVHAHVHQHIYIWWYQWLVSVNLMHF